jgi:hypothetical protein
LDKTLPYSEADETLAYWDDDEQTENTQQSVKCMALHKFLQTTILPIFIPYVEYLCHK